MATDNRDNSELKIEEPPKTVVPEDICIEGNGIISTSCDEVPSVNHCTSNNEVDVHEMDRSDEPHDGKPLQIESYLEPRPLHTEQEGSSSPKDIQKKLIRKVNLMNSNGETLQSSGEGPPPPHDKLGIKSRAESTEQQKSRPFLSIFKRKGSTSSGTTQTLAASSTSGLILENRPGSLPAKSLAEQKKHQKQYEEMVAAAKRKEIRKAEENVKHEERKKLREKMVGDAQKQWSDIIPKWEELHTTKRVRELWWLGLPPGIRGTVWKKAIGNELNISHDLYKICLRRCTDRLEQADQRDRSDSMKSLSREGSVEVIYLDVQRTFPTLGFFQEGGPYYPTLQDVLGAYACYRPDVGYVQGMSFIAAVFLLNMDAPDSFICLCNLLNRPSYLAFFRMDHDRMIPYFETYDLFLKDNLPTLHSHLADLKFKPEFYLIEWIFTIYTRVLPLDLACRVWDLFCRDGDIFLYRTAIGLLKMYSDHLLSLTSIEEVGHFLGHIPDSTDSDTLFQTISSVNIAEKKYKKLLSHHQKKT